MIYRRFRWSLLVIALFLFIGPANAREETIIQINPGSIEQNIDLTQTTTEIDYDKKEIRLPFNKSPNIIDFSPDGSYSYAVLTETGLKYFQFDGTKMVENTLLKIETTNPMGFAMTEPFPDITMINKEGISTFKFTGSSMQEVPSLSVQGLVNPISISSSQEGVFTILDDNEVKTFGFTGSELKEITSLKITDIQDPKAISTTGNDIAVIEKDNVKWFGFTGSEMREIPALSVAGLTDLKAVSIKEGRITVVDETKVKTFLFDGSKMSQINALSVLSGMQKPASVAIRPGSYDLLVVDDKNIDFYSFDGSSMVKNEALSIVVEDILSADGYVSKAVITSKLTQKQADMVRVRANMDLPEGTQITWFFTADGVDWTTGWRAKGNDLEVSKDNGYSWLKIGDLSDAGTNIDNKDLWVEVTPGNKVMWKAELKTTDKKVTPKVIEKFLGTAIKFDLNNTPLPPPKIEMPEDGWYYTTTPTFNWEFRDVDQGDNQSAFELEIRKQSNDSLVYSSGKIESTESKFTLPTSMEPNIPGPLWSSSDYAFSVRVKTWDTADAESEWSDKANFKVLAFERPRIAEISSTTESYEGLSLTDTASHLIIKPNTKIDDLPKVKAGSKVTLILDSVGPIKGNVEDNFTLPYLFTEAQMFETKRDYASGHAINRWYISFFTDASIKEVPSGTVVKLYSRGTGTEGGTTVFNLPPYADGVVVTEGSVYEDWFVVLQGSD